MANEISIRLADFSVANGNASYSLPSALRSLFRVDQAAKGVFANTQEIGTTHEALATGGLTTLGHGLFINLDDTNYVELGIDSGGTFHKLPRLEPGDPPAIMRVTGSTLYAQSNTAATDLFYILFED